MTQNWVTHRTDKCDYYKIEKPAIDFPYELDEFQKHAIMSIEQNDHVLVSVPTGAGKTSVCIYSIAHALNQGKRVIYTSPIKSLSNQKFKEFKNKFEPIYGSGVVGILTGDIKFNPDAMCVIMTTEILRNTLYRQGDDNKQQDSQNQQPINNINIDLSDIACVIFDEVHYINDRDRGKVWEETIVMLPRPILLVMLSATIDKPEKFAQWIGDLKEHRINLVTSNFRPVPLSHYIFSFNQDSGGANANNPTNLGKLIKIMDEHGTYLDAGYATAKQAYYTRYVDPATNKLKHIKGKTSQQANIQSQLMELSPSSLNPFLKFLQERHLLPALIFVLSRKNCEIYASNVNCSLASPMESVEITRVFNYHMHPYIKQYEKLGQFTVIKSLLEKGIGVHHSGLVPILKEIVEILFATGLIKILFCTETFAVGVNMPTKTVVFTETEKYDSLYNRKRLLKTDEYLQMAGRAGRRGLDTLGTVVHFPLHELPDRTELKLMMTGKTPEITSKFSLNYQFILKVIESDSQNLLDFVNSSLLSREQNSYLEYKMSELHQLKNENVGGVEQKQLSDTMIIQVAEYHKINVLLNSGFTFKPKQLTEYRQQLERLSNNNDPKFKQEYDQYLIKLDNKTHLEKVEKEVEYLKIKTLEDTKQVLAFLGELNYIKWIGDSDLQLLNKDSLLLKGLVGAQISECNEILLTELLDRNVINSQLRLAELGGILAIFIDESSSSDEPANFKSLDISMNLKRQLEQVQKISDELRDKEDKYGMNFETNWEIYTEFIVPAYYWANGDSLEKIYSITNIYEGNFIRGILKISHLAETVMKIAEMMGKMELSKLAETLSKSLIRDEVIVNSLYIR